MHPLKQTLRKVGGLIVLLSFLAACADSDTSTKIVQNGGTMMLSVGAYEELGHINFDETDITAKITDS
ncbi:MAG: hypothetical protein AB8C02_17520, partial [Halioglobus sp.]